MKVFLCGGGSGRQISAAMLEYSSVINKEKPILYIPLAMEETKYLNCAEWFKKEINMVGLTKFEMVTSSYELSQKKLKNYSSLYIGGGNTYKLLHELKQYGNFEKIKEYLNEDGIIFGGSAGAIVFGKDIDTCKFIDEKINEEKDGFNVLNEFSLLCHYNVDTFEENKEYLLEFSKNNKILYLPEEDVIYLNNETFKLIGNKEYIIFEDGNFRKTYNHIIN